MNRDFETLLSGSRLRLRARSAFFATLMLHAEIVPSREVALAGTDGERVFVNPDAAAALPSATLDGVLLHSVLHAALSHVPRRGPREQGRWNRAADTVVNGMVAQAGLPPLDGSPRTPELEHLSVEEVYAALDGQSQAGQQGGDGDGDLLDAPPTDAPARSGQRPGGTRAGQARHWQQTLAQARSAAAMAGQGSERGGLHRELGRMEGAQLDWRSHLWRFLARTPVDFGGFDRRFVGRGLYLEALDDESLRAFVCVDTSGSVDDAAVRALVAEVQGVLGAYPHVQATLYYADTELYGPHPLRPGDEAPAPQGGGGTDFRPFFEAAAQDEGAADLVIYLTDGYGDFPDTPPRLPVLWVVPPGGLDDEGFPFGEVLRLEDGV